MSTGPKHTETELLHRIADGDEEAFAEFFRRYFQEFYNIMFRYTKRHTEAEDIVQTIFIRAWEKKHVFKEMDNPINWFFITARNEYLDRFRKARRSKQYQQHLLEKFSEPEEISPESILSNKQYLDLYHRAIQNLPEKQRMAYLLSREKGLTYEAIAVEMNIEKSTVKEHIGRANRSIRTFIASKTGGSDELFTFLIFFTTVSPSFSDHSSLL